LLQEEGEMFINSNLLKKANSLPNLPGVYLMKDADNHIIYVGKAKILRNRVPGYFVGGVRHSEKILKMLEFVTDFDFIVTTSEYEALVLECSLIKQNKPKYNTLLKDDKGYCYVVVEKNKEEWNKIFLSRKKSKDENLYVGPFMSAATALEFVDQVNRIFKLPTCSKKLQKKAFLRPCLNYHIGRCCAPCAHKLSEFEYEQNFKRAVVVIKGNKKIIVAKLKVSMAKYAKDLEFEKAARERDAISALQKLKNDQHVILKEKIDCDVWGVVFSSECLCVTILQFRNGVLVATKELQVPETVELNFGELIVRYYMQKKIPQNVVIGCDSECVGLATRFLSSLCKNFEGIVLVEEKVKLLAIKEQILRKPLEKTKQLWEPLYVMAKDNVTQRVLLNQKSDHKKVLQSLKELLQLQKLPERIEVYDISNVASAVIVGAMIVFKSGEPFKSGYRRFKIKKTQVQDDYKSMQEIISRRCQYLISDSEKHTIVGTSFKEKPDLILIDGGKQHVVVVKKILDDFGLHVDVAGLVKDASHKTRAIVFGNQELKLKDSELYKLMARMQDEVHRFAINYAHKVHGKILFN
jgi:excinuclease ABC subunit C